MKKFQCFVVWIHEVVADSQEEADELFRQMIYEGNGNVEVEEVVQNVFARD